MPSNTQTIQFKSLYLLRAKEIFYFCTVKHSGKYRGPRNLAEVSVENKRATLFIFEHGNIVLMSVVVEGYHHPACSWLVVASIAVFAAASTGFMGTSERSFGYSYRDIFSRRGPLKVLGGGVGSFSYVHLLLAVTSLWCARGVESRVGSWLFLQYSVVIIFSSAALKLAFVASLAWYANRTPHMREQVTFNLSNTLPASGLLEVTFAWLMYASFDEKLAQTTYFVLGIIPIAFPLAPLVLMMISQVLLKPINYFAFMTAMISGLLLYLGPLQIAPTPYWSTVFALDLTLYIGHTLFSRFPATGLGNNLSIGGEEQRGFVFVPVFDDDDEDGSGSGDTPLREVSLQRVNSRGSSHDSDTEAETSGASFGFGESYQRGHRRQHQQHQLQLPFAQPPSGDDPPDEEMGLLARSSDN